MRKIIIFCFFMLHCISNCSFLAADVISSTTTNSSDKQQKDKSSIINTKTDHAKNLNNLDSSVNDLGDDSYDEYDVNLDSLSDPGEKVNRIVFTFNELLYGKILNNMTNKINSDSTLEYHSQTLNDIAPKKPSFKDQRHQTFNISKKEGILETSCTKHPLQKITTAIFSSLGKLIDVCGAALENFIINTRQPIVMLNSILQLDFRNFAISTYRLVMNSTLGIGGLLDTATYFSAPQNKLLTFNSTLAKLGIPSGFYMVLPIVGAFTTRSLIGSTFDLFLNPVQFAFTPHYGIYYAIYGGEQGLILIKTTQSLHEASSLSLDPYAMYRGLYAQKFG